MTLTLTMEEFEQLHTAWGESMNIKLGSHVLRYIYDFAAGQAGSVSLILDYLGTPLVNEAKLGDVNLAASYKLTSPRLLAACSASRSIIHIRQMRPLQRQLLLQLLNDGRLDDAVLSAEYSAALRGLYVAGMVVPDEQQAGVYRFTSPMHELVTAQGAYFDLQSVPDFKQLLKLMLQRLDPDVLSTCQGRAAKTGRLLEGVYHEVYRAISGLLPIDPGTGKKAVLSPFVGQLFGVNGFMDLYVSEPWFWGFELLLDGTGLAEHTQRFQPGGAYYMMREQGQLKYMAVLDMRAEDPGALKSIPNPPAAAEADLCIIRACFAPGYRSVVVHGLEEQPITLDVCGPQGVSSNCSGAEMGIRRQGMA